MIEVLEVLNDHMVKELKLNYEFGQYTKTPPKYPYWVSDYTEPEPLEEDGLPTPTVTLTGSLNVPSDEQDLKRCQINLSIKKWSV